jgi:hypothetical protein
MQLCLNYTGILYLYTDLADAMPYACSNLCAVVREEESAMQECALTMQESYISLRQQHQLRLMCQQGSSPLFVNS